VRDNIDTIDHCPDDRVMQKANGHRIYQCEEETADRGCDDGSRAQVASVTGTTVLVIAGMSISATRRALTRAAALSSPSGITLNVFDSLAYLPHYSETLEGQPLPRPVEALRNAAIEAHAAMVLTHYHGHIPAMVHNAIDWLTRRWNHSALHNKPLAIIGPTDDGYSGVWSHHQTEESRRIAATRIVEPITVTTLHEAVTKLAEQANIANQPSSPIPVPGPHSRSNSAHARGQLR
jgi:NAD(P)H-dependent FMN reductase